MIAGHACLLALKAGRPVKMVYDRVEDMLATTKRHPGVIRHRTGVTRDGAIARRIRLNIVPAVAPAVFAFRTARRFMFRTLSQTVVHYRASSLSEGRAGAVHGGDRLPWVPAASNDLDNFVALSSLEWHIHVYGDASRDVRAACDERKLPLHVFPWGQAMSRAGLRRNAVYLVRPDGYVALAAPDASGAAIRSYLDSRKVAAASREGSVQ